MDTQWSTHILPIEAGLRIFSATDGIYDQVGGEYQVGFGVRRFAKTLHEHGQEPIATQGESTMRDFIAYQGSQHRRDDFAFVGLQAG
jgi:serine phosphatase RsbU (regulator of sigma subunit)